MLISYRVIEHRLKIAELNPSIDDACLEPLYERSHRQLRPLPAHMQAG